MRSPKAMRAGTGNNRFLLHGLNSKCILDFSFSLVELSYVHTFYKHSVFLSKSRKYLSFLSVETVCPLKPPPKWPSY